MFIPFIYLKHAHPYYIVYFYWSMKFKSFLQTWKNSFSYDECLFTNTILVVNLQELSFQSLSNSR